MYSISCSQKIHDHDFKANEKVVNNQVILTTIKKMGSLLGCLIDSSETDTNKTLGRARDPRANSAWLSKLTE